jgi:adenosylhomocysteine nucleosidase
MEKDPLIGLIFATMTEAKPFIQGMTLEKVENEAFSVFQKGQIVLIISGIGKVNGAMAAAYCCQTFHPALVCNLGAAGATNSSLVLGDIVHVREAVEYDRLELKSNKPHVHIPHILDGFPLSTIATQDTPVIEAEKREEIASFAALADMEAASVIQVCHKFQTKCVIFKFVSDTPDHRHGDDIVENIKQYRRSFYEFFQNAIMPRLIASVVFQKTLT